MTSEQIENELLEIAAIARGQADGAYTIESDARQALELICRLARLLAELKQEAKP